MGSRLTGLTYARRTLVFDHLSEVIGEVQRLCAGHCTIGQWSLAQTCHHLALSVAGSIDGFGVRHHRVMRWLFGRMALRKVFSLGVIDPGFTITEDLNPPPDVPLADAVDRLEREIDRYERFTGIPHFHPFFGHLTRDEWDRLHCIHCAHHLSLMMPIPTA
jgi:Protein of unknown function (DUF1569)